ncbi:MAG: Thymidylate kinase [Bacteroidia bacterium]|nr:Thymidylate kinase [Bacteroidia bacterium]MCE7955294.1 dTMP kinase [Bacteroidetes bacterium CHB6]
MPDNLFIALEGIDGSGKSTQARLLNKNLSERGFKTYLTNEPTDHRVGKLIRSIFSHETEANQHTIAALFVADRLQHILDDKNGLLQKLKEGYSVICDRYYFSSYAYHSVFVDMDWVIQINKICAELIKPDITIFIDADPEICMQRLKDKRHSLEMYETLDNLKKVRENYFKAFDKLKSSEQIVIVNGNNTEGQIAVEIEEIVRRTLKTKK